jgi:3-oxoacyl-[acyl-carrier protein] reductase
MITFADFEAIKVGDRQELTKPITEEDIRRFVQLTGDDNPLHVDPSFAASTPYKDIVVHGMLGASFISTVIGTKLPGPGALWVSQSLDFLLPVRLGDVLTVVCSVRSKHERERLLELDTQIFNQNEQLVLSGSGRVKLLALKERPTSSVSVPLMRVAVVTGASGGIGQAVCRRLAADGFAVVVNFRQRREIAQRLVNELLASGAQAVAVQGDVATEAGCKAVVEAAVGAFGGIDLLVNNASPRINPKKFPTLEWRDIEHHLNVQLRGAFQLSKASLPYLSGRSNASIVNITSQVIDGAPTSTWTSYAIGKSALAMLARYLAAELGPSGVRVNCVSPGMTETSLIGDIPEKVQLLVARQTPLRRLAQPEDVAAAVAYLASADSAFVTGHTLRVNGGVVVS